MISHDVRKQTLLSISIFSQLSITLPPFHLFLQLNLELREQQTLFEPPWISTVPCLFLQGTFPSAAARPVHLMLSPGVCPVLSGVLDELPHHSISIHTALLCSTNLLEWLTINCSVEG